MSKTAWALALLAALTLTACGKHNPLDAQVRLLQAKDLLPAVATRH